MKGWNRLFIVFSLITFVLLANKMKSRLTSLILTFGFASFANAEGTISKSDIESHIADSVCTINVSPAEGAVKSSGSGFLCVINSVEFLVTNIHVIAGAESFDDLTIKTRNNVEIHPSEAYIANDRDICIMKFSQNPNLKPLTLSDSLQEQGEGEALYAYGNALGGGVLLKSEGLSRALGPKLIELDISAFPGNSGGPVIAKEGGTVLGVLTKAELVPKDDFTKAALNKAQSPIDRDIRLYATRLDNIPSQDWRLLDWKIWTNERALIKEHTDNLIAFSALVRSNSSAFIDTNKEGESIHRLTIDADILVNSPELWRAYIKYKHKRMSLNRTNNSMEVHYAFKHFTGDVSTLHSRTTGALPDGLKSHNWHYDWFVTDSAGNVGALTMQDILDGYSTLHTKWGNICSRSSVCIPRVLEIH
jgi:hypothetical protein|tara:strand:+ start:1555 stop:2811 length:1257 start_codon:yes stop_codon:yes gene_type:complete